MAVYRARKYQLHVGQVRSAAGWCFPPNHATPYYRHFYIEVGVHRTLYKPNHFIYLHFFESFKFAKGPLISRVNRMIDVGDSNSWQQ